MLTSAPVGRKTAVASPRSINRWLCQDTICELRGLPPRALVTGQRPTGVEATWSDFFCGAGGSMKGFTQLPGAAGLMAVNHWLLAIETHNFNFPDVDHDQANVARADPRRYPRTDFAWFSPECTYWSVARGERCDYDTDQLPLEGLAIEGDGDPDKPAAAESKRRSRMLMRDVVRFSEYHGYRGVVVENVPDILKWSRFDRWIADMRKLGYRHKVITLNAAFSHAYGPPAPQLRDRVYVVFWLARYPTPDWDKWLRPQAWCPNCEQVVRGVYQPKAGGRRPMRYGSRAQYVYRCPKVSCRAVTVQPYILPALSAIDLSLPTQRIGDRKKPLAAATRTRVEAGVRQHWPRHRGMHLEPAAPLLVPAGGTWNEQVTPATAPMRTRTTRENEALVSAPFLTVLRSGRPRTIHPDEHPLATVVADGSGHALVDPPLLVPVEARDGQRARPATGPMRVQTGRHQDALVASQPEVNPAGPPSDSGEPHTLVVPLRNNGVAHPAGNHPLMTVAAGGEHHAFVMRNNTARGDQGQMATTLDEPLRTLLAEGRQSLVDWSNLLYSYDTGAMRPLVEPMPAQTTVEGDAVVGPSINIDDCTLRMLAVKEIQAGQAFPDEFVLLGTAKRDKVRMLGNAVPPPCARDVAAALMEAVCRLDYELFDFAQVGW